jgi:hypothetical protein
VTTAWAVTLPVIAYLVMTVAAHRSMGGWRTPLLAAAVAWGLALVLVTEALSRFHALARPGLIVAWLGILALAAFVCARSRAGPRAPAPPAGPLDRGAWALLGATGLLVLAVGTVALIAPPNTFDSLTYHMSRVAHWIQNRSVEPYPTGIQRQLYQSPAAEFVILHLQILAGGGDRLVNLAQWSCLVGSLVAASLTVRHLGGGPGSQVLAAVIVATIPMGVLQASSTKNDYFVAFWLVTMLALGLGPEPRSASRRRWLVVAVGGAFGLAILTKPTAYLFGAPLLGVILVRWARTSGRRRAGLAAAGVALLAIAVNAGHSSRNATVYGSPLGPAADAGYTYVAETARPALVASTVLRNIALHLTTPSEAATAAVERAALGVLAALGVDPDDSRVTWRGERFALRWTRHENAAGSPLHLLLLTVALVVLVIGARRRPVVLAYVAALVVGWVAFSAVLKWQPWHSRLHLPFFVAAAPLTAIALGDRGRLRIAVGAVLLLGALPVVLWNPSRPLAGAGSVLGRDRTELYFTSVAEGMAPYANAARVLRDLGCRRFGLETGGSAAPEYVMWVLTQSLTSDGHRIEHVGGGVEPPPTGKVFVPCSIIAWNHGHESYGHIGVLYSRVWGSTAIGVYAPPSVWPTAPPWPFLVRLEHLARMVQRRGAGPDRRPSIRLDVDGEAIPIGQRLVLAIDVRLPAESPPMQVYVGLLFPDGVHTSTFDAPDMATPPTEIRRMQTLRPFTMPPGERVVVFDRQVSPAYPRGQYKIFAAVAPAAGPRSPDADDFVAADVRTVHVVP